MTKIHWYMVQCLSKKLKWLSAFTLNFLQNHNKPEHFRFFVQKFYQLLAITKESVSNLKGLTFSKYTVLQMPMFQRVGLREGGKPLPLAFQYLILMI